MATHHSVVVVGGGISGLAVAWWLWKAGVEVLLLERDPEIGGTMKTIVDDGWLIEAGANSALETTPLVRTLATDVGIVDQLVYGNELANNRYVLRDGKLHPLPLSPAAFVRSKLWSARGKLRLLKEPFVGESEKEESVAEFVVRRLGSEFLDYAINPFVAGVYAGNPEDLSVQAAFPRLYALEQNYGGLIKGQILGARDRRKRAEKAKDRARLFAFKDGMQTLPRAVAKALNPRVWTVADVQKIDRGDREGKGYVIEGSHQGSNFEIVADSVILAIPAYRAADLVEPLDPSLASTLRSIYYPPVAEVFLGFRESDIKRRLDGFGFLVPAKEHRQILGTIWSSSLFPNRAPSGHVALTSFLGGSRQPEVLQNSDQALVETVRRELHNLMQVDGSPVYARVTRWDKAIPQYRLGYLGVLDQLQAFEDRSPGWFFSGNYRGGISVSDCIISSDALARRVIAFVDRSQRES